MMMFDTEDRELWETGGPGLMSDEESDDDDKDVWMITSPTWRTPRFEASISTADQRLDERGVRDKNAGKVRRRSVTKSNRKHPGNRYYATGHTVRI